MRRLCITQLCYSQNNACSRWIHACLCVWGWVGGGWGVRACARACVRACVCVYVRERESERGVGGREEGRESDFLLKQEVVQILCVKHTKSVTANQKQAL